MNERIKELIEQAEEYAFDELNKLQGPVEMSISRRVFEQSFREKFAELLIQECCEQLIKEGNDWEQFSLNPPDGQAHNASGALFAAYRLKEDAVDMLREHFGVEE